MFQHYFFDRKIGVNNVVFDIAPAHRVKQIHSKKVIEINGPQDQWIEADGIITRTSNLPIGIITADCAPVLFYAEDVVGAAHAGWQGALNGVLDNTVQMMDIDPSIIQAFIGPCIQQEAYEVSVGFEKPFIDRDSNTKQFFKPSKTQGKLQFDLSGYCTFRLRQCGIKNIDVDTRDTLTSPDFHSHRGGANYKERNLSAIMLME